MADGDGIHNLLRVVLQDYPRPFNNPPGAPNSTVSAPALLDCDYSLPDFFGGWGWNPMTGEFCSPNRSLPNTCNNH